MGHSADRTDADRSRPKHAGGFGSPGSTGGSGGFGSSGDPLARLTRGIVAMVAVGFCAASVVATVRNHDGLAYQLPAVALLLVLLGLQIGHAGPWRLARRWWPWSLVVHGVLTYLPFLLFDGAWVGIPGSFAGSVLLTVALPRSWVLFVVLVAAQYPLCAALGGNPGQCVNASVSTAVGGIVVYGVARLADLTAELRAARTELAELAVDRERLRFARDLHDLLGSSLSVAALKCQLAERLAAEEPERARAEIAEVLALVRQAMADARRLPSGDLGMSLAREARSAVSALRSAGIGVEVELDCEGLRPELDAVLATVLREAVTNLLRHSAARRCGIRAGRDEFGAVRLVVSNDGVPPEPGGAPREEGGGPGSEGGGHGIGNLTVRLRAVGGRLTAERDGAGWFHLTAVVEAEPAREAARAA
ncbi:sensor histidine kinase [Kitasatospora sp. NPDC058063]|uniref:sensor histidine kinase n=1 Tax=unclassified Kitasatospora TaxID=2633591 RepID=UPI0036DD659B